MGRDSEVIALELQCDLSHGEAYRSNAQIVRVVTENWFETQMYCLACSSNTLTRAPNNCPGIDFTCPTCAARFQLKSRKPSLSNRIVDAGYDAMIRAIRSDNAPNLALLQYSRSWSVVSLTVVPSFFFTESAIEKRKPLSASARRANWVGCNILLDRIPVDGRIAVVTDGIPVNPSLVRGRYGQALPLRELDVSMRGWTLDVLSALRAIGKREVALSDLYAFEDSLQKSHPKNSNVRPKIRQQLQVLRDLGFIAFEGRGRYRVLRY